MLPDWEEFECGDSVRIGPCGAEVAAVDGADGDSNDGANDGDSHDGANDGADAAPEAADNGGPGGNFRLACTPSARLRGLPAYPHWNGTLLIAPCSDIHTFTVRRPIDVAFVREDGTVLASYRGVRPKRRIRCVGAKYVLERWEATEKQWFLPGETVNLQSGERIASVKQCG